MGGKWKQPGLLLAHQPTTLITLLPRLFYCVYFELCPLFNNIINPRIIIIGYKYYIINTDPLFQELLLCGVCSWSPGLRGEDGGHSEQPLPGLACLPGHASGTVHQHRLTQINPNFRDITRNVEENEIPHEIFRVVSRVPRYISCYIAESITFGTV